MSFYVSNNIGIAGIACAVPDNLVNVSDFSERFGEEVTEKFTAGTGICSMYKALPEQTASDLAYKAAEELLAKTRTNREEIGLLVFVTQSPDYRRPSTACVLQKRLSLNIDCATIEINQGCSGFIYGMQTVLSLMSQSDYKYSLLLMGETASKLVNPNDKSIVMMYGDAGAAILLERKTGVEIKTLLRSDGQRYRSIILPAGGFRDMNPQKCEQICKDGISRSLYDIFMDGTAVFSFSITDVPLAIEEYLLKTGANTDDYDVFLLHQANRFIINQIIRKLKLQKKEVPISLDRYGNSGGISIPLTICDKYGDDTENTVRALMCGFGIGLSWGVTNAVIDTDKVFPIIKTKEWYEDGKIKLGEY